MYVYHIRFDKLYLITRFNYLQMMIPGKNERKGAIILKKEKRGTF